MDEKKIISLLSKFGFIETSEFDGWEKKEGPLTFNAIIGQMDYTFPVGLCIGKSYYDGRVLAELNYSFLGENPSEEDIYEYMENIREEFGLGDPNIKKLKTAIQTNNPEALKKVIHDIPVSLLNRDAGI